MKKTSVCAIMQTEVIFIYCYFCEDPPTGDYFLLENKRMICLDCLGHIGLYELLDALGLSHPVQLLQRFHMASHHPSEPNQHQRRYKP